MRPKVFENIRKERGELGCVQICTYGTISTKAAIKIACFDENTLVLTDNGEKRIIDIIPKQDKVLTTNGWEFVTAKTCLDDKDVIAIKTKNSTNPYIFCTPDHEFLIIETKNNGTRNCGKTDTKLAKQIFPEINIYDSQNTIFQRYQRNIVHCTPKWIKAQDIKQGQQKGVRGLTKIDRTIKNIKEIKWENNFAGKHGRGISTSIAITEDFCELIGIFLAEGNIGYDFSGINFTIHQKEIDFKDRIIELMWNVFQLDNYGLSYKKESQALVIRYSSRQLGSFFKQLFQCQITQDCTQWNKRVPNILRKIHPYLQLQIIKGFFLGDGYASIKRTPVAKLTTVSKKMADDFIDIYHRNFIQPFVDVEDYDYKRSITYNVVVYSEKAKNLYHLKYEDGIRERYIITPLERSQRDMPVEYNGDIYMTSNLVRPINHLKNKKIRKNKVYCLVTPSHNFTVNSVIVHNCRGYRSSNCPDGIELDEAEYLSSLIPQERGFLYSLSDCFYGNQEKERRPSQEFIKVVNSYPGLKEILLGIEGLIQNRSIHASGVGFYDNDNTYDEACFMKAKDGSIITQWSLHDQEYAGTTKVDILVTQQMDIMAQCIKLLQEYGKIEPELTLRQAYDKYVSPDVLPMNDDKLWNAVDSTDILALFQLVSDVGSKTVKKILPRDIETLNDCNGIMRLMADDSGETPTDRYVRLMNHPEQWDKEMDSYGLTKKEQSVIKEYIRNGVLIDQETLMRIVMDKCICGFTLSESNSLRRCVAKKHMDEIPIQRQKILERATSPAMGKYIWFLLQPSMGYSFK